jgi:hypothetical protein
MYRSVFGMLSHDPDRAYSHAAESESAELPSTRRWVPSQAARHQRAALMLERRYG